MPKAIYFILCFLLSLFFAKTTYAFSYIPENLDNSITTDLIYKVELPNTVKYNQLIGKYVVSDEDENFYLISTSGIHKFSELGEEIYTINITLHNPSLAYSNNRLYVLSKKNPGYFYIFNSETGEEIEKITVAPGLNLGSNSYLFVLTDLIVTHNEKYIYFGARVPYGIFRYSIENEELKFAEMPFSSLVSALGAYENPTNVGDNKVMFSTRSGYLEVISQDNFSTHIYLAAPYDKYVSLRNITFDAGIQYVVANNLIFANYIDHLCVFDLSHGDIKECIDYTQSREVADRSYTNLVYSDGVIIFNSQLEDGEWYYYLNKYSDSLDFKWKTKINANEDTYLYKNYNGTISWFEENLYILDPEDGEIIDVYEFDEEEGYHHYASIASPTAKGNYYIFDERVIGPAKYRNYIYKFRGLKSETPECELGFYCDSEPKHNPILLVHGLGGHYTQWIEGERAIIKEKILQEFRKDDPEFPEHWIHAYSYGYKFGKDYNYQGRLEDISSGMHFDVERLANEHKLAGGDGKVDIIAYSLGGLVSRHYILEKTGFPGEQDLEVDHHVRKLILVASPVNGSTLVTEVDNRTEHDPVLNNQIKELVNSKLSSPGHPIDVRKDVWTQISYESTYFKITREYKLPDTILYFRTYSDILLDFNTNIFGIAATRKISIGDGAVYPDDTRLLNDFTDEHVINRRVYINLYFNLFERRLDFDFPADLSTTIHMRLLEHPETVTKLLNYLYY